jgi:hypothetical protein
MAWLEQVVRACQRNTIFDGSEEQLWRPALVTAWRDRDTAVSACAQNTTKRCWAITPHAKIMAFEKTLANRNATISRNTRAGRPPF